MFYDLDQKFRKVQNGLAGYQSPRTMDTQRLNPSLRPKFKFKSQSQINIWNVDIKA